MLVAGALPAPAARAQQPAAAPAAGSASEPALEASAPRDSVWSAGQKPVALSLEDAIRIARSNSYDLQDARLDVRNANAQVRQTWGRVYPQVNATGGYTRNVKTANPFAGSDVTGLFAGGGSTQWVTFNERARTDGNPQTDPIRFQEFQRRQQQARREAGITSGGGGNPFGVDNEFQGAVSIRQTLYNGQAFRAIDGAQTLKDANQRALDRQEQLLIDEVRRAYYQAMLARAQVKVAEQSVERARETFQEVSQRVSAGTAPKSERLGADVELANRRTERVQAEADYESARDNLKQTLGVDVTVPIRLDGTLQADRQGQYVDVSTGDALDIALENRPDLERARLNVELQKVRTGTEQATYLPTVAAVANLSMSGRVPDDRTVTITNPNDPFDFDTATRDFFSDAYWNPSISVGLELSWTIFDGFQRQARIQQEKISTRRSQVQLERLRQSVRLQVRRALRDLDAARQRIQAQEENLQTAETNYRYARRRLDEGVTGQLQVREASRQLDQSRLNYLRAVSDYLRARSAFEAAIGRPTPAPGELQASMQP